MTDTTPGIRWYKLDENMEPVECPLDEGLIWIALALRERPKGFEQVFGPPGSYVSMAFLNSLCPVFEVIFLLDGQQVELVQYSTYTKARADFDEFVETLKELRPWNYSPAP